MIDFVVDTNILIYCSQKQEKYADFLARLGVKTFGISVISLIEILVGSKNEMEFFMLSDFLENFGLLSLNKSIGTRVARKLMQDPKKSFKNPHIADICIAETALFYKTPLITNNARDFRAWKSLQIITP